MAEEKPEPGISYDENGGWELCDDTNMEEGGATENALESAQSEINLFKAISGGSIDNTGPMFC